MDLLLATRNPNKTREFQELLGMDFKVLDLHSFPDLVVPEETGRTFEENAVLKAVAASRHVRVLAENLDVFADDSGLEVDSLGGAPGIYSARYAGTGAGDHQNIDKLIRELARQDVPVEKRTARFRCVIAFASRGKLIRTFEGVVEGTIVSPGRGDNGFGYDPVFQPIGCEQTFGEMPPELKNKLSHRAKAAAAMRLELRSADKNRTK
jgi:XTP/dITP diphosphohydrolase